MRDFTLDTYRRLLQTLLDQGYTFYTFEQYLRQRPQEGRFVILRHDVDLLPVNSLRTAQLEYRLGIRASYYFRIVPESNHPVIIRSIAALGHEIGYHYEDLSITDGDITAAEMHFRQKLDYFRTYYPVVTVCMHGAPTSPYDSRDLWKHYDYHDYGLLGEPYFDVDFSCLCYLTDTGRCWDGYRVSVRDRIPEHQDRWIAQGWSYHHTDDIIRAAQAHTLPDQLMMTTHPQRWTDRLGPWTRELLVQNAKNIVKRLLINHRQA